MCDRSTPLWRQGGATILSQDRPYCGYAGKVLHVDLDSGSFEEEKLAVDLARSYIGGRGFNIHRLWHQVPRGLPGLDRRNVLAFGVGPFNGTLFPGAGRFNVSAMSPQTGILGDSNAGGFFGPEVKFAGYDGIVITGRAASPVYLWIAPEGPRLVPAGDLAALDVWQVQEEIIRRTGDTRTQVAATGPAAAAGVLFSGVFCNLVRAAARTGMGAVMASKNLRAVAVRGTRPVTVARGDRLKSLVDRLWDDITGHDQYLSRCHYGTTRLVSLLNDIGALGSYHYRAGRFDAAHDVSGERLAELYKVKSKACFSCPVPCSRFIRAGELETEGPEFEGLAGFTSMLGISDLKGALHAIDRCNRYGIDVIAASESIAFVIECHQEGLLGPEDCDGLTPRWGDIGFALDMVDRIARRQGVGDLLGDGVKRAADQIGGQAHELAMHVKGLEFFKADPRGLKGYGLGLAVASRGGDHLRSEPSFEFSGDLDEAERRYGTADAALPGTHGGKGPLVKDFEELCALSDSWNACKNTIVNMEVMGFDRAAEFYEALTGLDMTGEELQRACERIVNLERAFIVREGITREDDRLPRRFLSEPLDQGGGSGSTVDLDSMLDDYYMARGWDPATGIPTAGTLRRLDLDHVIPDIRG